MKITTISQAPIISRRIKAALLLIEYATRIKKIVNSSYKKDNMWGAKALALLHFTCLMAAIHLVKKAAAKNKKGAGFNFPFVKYFNAGRLLYESSIYIDSNGRHKPWMTEGVALFVMSLYITSTNLLLNYEMKNPGVLESNEIGGFSAHMAATIVKYGHRIMYAIIGEIIAKNMSQTKKVALIVALSLFMKTIGEKKWSIFTRSVAALDAPDMSIFDAYFSQSDLVFFMKADSRLHKGMLGH